MESDKQQANLARWMNDYTMEHNPAAENPANFFSSIYVESRVFYQHQYICTEDSLTSKNKHNSPLLSNCKSVLIDIFFRSMFNNK